MAEQTSRRGRHSDPYQPLDSTAARAGDAPHLTFALLKREVGTGWDSVVGRYARQLRGSAESDRRIFVKVSIG